MKKILLLAALLSWAFSSGAQTREINSFIYAGPYPVSAPYIMDSLNVHFASFTNESLLDTYISLDMINEGKSVEGSSLPIYEDGYALNLAGFTIENTRYATASLKVEGVKNYKSFLDGKEIKGGKMVLEPATHSVVIKYLSVPNEKYSLKVTLETDGKTDSGTDSKTGGEINSETVSKTDRGTNNEDDCKSIAIRSDNNKLYTIYDVLHGTHFGRIEVSPDGKYLITGYRTSLPGGETISRSTVREISSGKVLAESPRGFQWMPSSNRYYFTRKSVNGTQLVSVDPSTGTETVMAENLPEGHFEMSPTEDFLIYTMMEEGPSERSEIYQVLEPDDRQPGWRNRSYLAKYDLKKSIMQPLTFGHRNVWSADISSDGRYLLMMGSESRLTKRPTTLFSIYLMDLSTLETRTLVDKDGFISGAAFSPDGRQILIQGSPESFDGIGKNVEEGQTPSMTDIQLYIMDIAGGKVTPVTKNFNPSIQRAQWNKSDGQIYFTAENRDYYSLYRMNPANGDIKQIDVPEDLVSSFSLAGKAPVLAFFGQGASNSDRLYIMNTKKLKSSIMEDLSAVILKDKVLGECREWNFVSSKGDTIYGRYYLPPYFDSSKKYPVIVNYYGGCSPVSRNFESRYPHHAYAALGYVVYVIEPSGSTGFGQKFSARHVNTAGEGVAEDIIEGTRQFCSEHSFADGTKIGCIGASYGGFMTQFLQTKTDMFAAAVSHAGISDHTSYWGVGYWGYSYSEVSMANSYPWSDPDLYIKQSPLFNADKIHTPLLLIHGDSDVNVPTGESIQLFTALKLLGRETALVEVSKQDHHILDYDKRILWHNTIMAWFAKWLQDDPQWWNAMYPQKSL